jgi:hypothetical protein
VGDYVSDILLGLSLMGAPIVFGMLLFYGLSISDHHHHSGDGPATPPPKSRSPDGTGAAH